MKCAPSVVTLVTLLGLASCVPTLQKVPNPDTPRTISKTHTRAGDRIEIFFDGTANNWSSRTNVRRRFEMVANAEDPAVHSLYIDGVGNESQLAKALGIGMKTRVVEGYKFLSRHWQDGGTKIYIFGFSRGALQARMLAGMLAHCGLPTATSPEGRRLLTDAQVDKIAEDLWIYSRDHLTDADDGSSEKKWALRLAENREQTRQHIAATLPNVKFVNPDIAFLGLWDTVPGLQFTKLSGEGTRSEDGGTRYKVRPYPNIRVIGHALALDERRSKFQPLRVGPPLDAQRTKVYEVWFPGAHADIGGGYEDSNDLAGTSFNWMHKLMYKHRLVTRERLVYEDVRSILHHPERVFPNNLGSKNQARILPKDSRIDKTMFIRANADYAPEQGGAGNLGYVKLPYRPKLTIALGDKDNSRKDILITPTVSLQERRALIEPHLKLYDSTLPDEDQKPLTGPALQVQDMQVQVEKVAAPEPAAAPIPVKIAE